MQKWEYHVEDMTYGKFIDTEIIKRLDELGELGWELVTVSTENSGTHNNAFFKRPIEETSPDS
jgi:hypothetical protein